MNLEKIIAIRNAKTIYCENIVPSAKGYPS